MQLKQEDPEAVEKMVIKNSVNSKVKHLANFCKNKFNYGCI